VKVVEVLSEFWKSSRDTRHRFLWKQAENFTLKKVMFMRPVRPPAGNAVPSIYGTDVIDGFSSLLPGAQLRLRRENRNARTENLPEATRPQ
jgi:hypothetical protein